MIVREASSSDHQTIYKVVEDAFRQKAEADLINDLRKAGDAVLEFVAEVDGEIVGHLLMSKLEAPANTLALAPIAVSPHYQKRGVASSLIREALERVKTDGWSAVFVLGEPEFYSRFGFEVGKAEKFETEYPKNSFMALELREGSLTLLSGKVVYPQPFRKF